MEYRTAHGKREGGDASPPFPETTNCQGGINPIQSPAISLTRVRRELLWLTKHTAREWLA